MNYIVTGKKNGVQIRFKYGENGLLQGFESMNQEFGTGQLLYIVNNIPAYANWLDKKFPSDRFKIEKEPEDLSFEHFWDAYNYKIGNKQRAKKLWDGLNDADRTACLGSLPKYKYYLATHQGIEKAHATTYLNQRRWENEYK
jgi:hypothetical protein